MTYQMLFNKKERKDNIMSSRYIILFALTTILSGCTMSMKGDWAAREYCGCDEGDLLDRAKCKKDVLVKYKDELKNDEFRKAFHDHKCD